MTYDAYILNEVKNNTNNHGSTNIIIYNNWSIKKLTLRLLSVSTTYQPLQITMLKNKPTIANFLEAWLSAHIKA